MDLRCQVVFLKSKLDLLLNSSFFPKIHRPPPYLEPVRQKTIRTVNGQKKLDTSVLIYDKLHFFLQLNEEYLKTVTLEKAHRENVEFIKSYKLKGEQLIDYFIDSRGYQSFVPYWNSKIRDLKT